MLPLTTAILMELQRAKGSASDKQLLKNVRKIMSQYNGDVSAYEFYKALMKLELRGLIRVESIKRGARMVYLANKR